MNYLAVILVRENTPEIQPCDLKIAQDQKPENESIASLQKHVQFSVTRRAERAKFSRGFRDFIT